MGRVYNFSAGPSMLPEKVLKQAQAELLEGKGQQIGKEPGELALQQAERDTGRSLGDQQTDPEFLFHR